MAGRRSATRDDIFLKTRLISEGVQLIVDGPLEWSVGDPFVGPIIIFNECDMVAETRFNPRSRLEFIVKGRDVTISEMGEVLATATLEPRAPWRDIIMSDGTTVDSAYLGSMAANYINISNRCYTYDSGKGCKFCHPGALYALAGPRWTFDETLRSAERQIEATVIAAQHGWRGLVLFIGGALPPEMRDQWTTDLFEALMERFRQSLDDSILAELEFQPSVYPPKDFGYFQKWKDMGINSVGMDIQVMDPDYYRALCPGRGDQRYWLEAQEAAVEVFGHKGGCVTNVVTGIEPMDGLLKGFEERTSKGVAVHPVVFYRGVGAAMAGMEPPSAEWYMEAFEKMDEIRARYGYAVGFAGPGAQTDLWRYH